VHVAHELSRRFLAFGVGREVNSSIIAFGTDAGIDQRVRRPRQGGPVASGEHPRQWWWGTMGRVRGGTGGGEKSCYQEKPNHLLF